MYTACPVIISEQGSPEIFEFAERNSALAKKLYNAALFRIRQVFTGWDKQKRSRNEEEVFAELEETKKAYPHVSFRRVLTYYNLDKVMRATKNPDFFAGLPMQTAQDVLRDACKDFKGWLNDLKDYKKDPGKYSGKPGMPKYKKDTRKTFQVTNQDANLYPGESPDSCMLKLPGFPKNHWFPIQGVPSGSTLKEMSFKPYYGKYIMTFVIEKLVPPFYPELPNMAGLDFGVDNIAAIVSTDGASVVYKGGAVLSENQYFHKNKAEAVSIITKGHSHMHAESAHLDRLSLHHDCFMKGQMHKISADIIQFCLGHRVGTLVIGVNKGWKQEANIGRKNNQNFCGIPHTQLRWMVTYKALIAGINVVEQEESYTSKADITAGDFIPAYGQVEGRPSFSGRRIRRGLYLCGNGLLINADCNGAANILRKAFPDAWKGRTDFKFLAVPESRGFHYLNPKYRLSA